VNSLHHLFKRGSCGSCWHFCTNVNGFRCAALGLVLFRRKAARPRGTDRRENASAQERYEQHTTSTCPNSKNDSDYRSSVRLVLDSIRRHDALVSAAPHCDGRLKFTHSVSKLIMLISLFTSTRLHLAYSCKHQG
jgi:hypothetical protein